MGQKQSFILGGLGLIPLIISVMPPLIAWSALLSIENLSLSLGLILVSFLISAVHDYYLYQQQKISQLWFITMRISLSSIVIVITSLMFLFVF